MPLASSITKPIYWYPLSNIKNTYFAYAYAYAFAGPLIQSFGLCETGLVDSTLLSACINGQLTIAAIVNLHISNYPNTPFAFIQSKIDAVQQSFYVAVGVTTKNTSAVISKSKSQV